jgi:hypothetical protein
MTLSDIAAIASLVSSLGVLASLVFISKQIRQTERNQRSLINQGILSRDNAIMAILEEPAVAAVYVKAHTSATDYTLVEVLQFGVFVRTVMGQMQDVFMQKSAGLIDQDTYDFIEAGVRYVFSLPLARLSWIDSRATVSPKVAALIDGFIATTPQFEADADPGATFKRRLTDILSPT